MMLPGRALLLLSVLFAGAIWAQVADPQTPNANYALQAPSKKPPASDRSSYCQQASSGLAHADQLAAVCTFAATVRKAAPDYFCREDIASSLRGQWVNAGARSNVVSAEVRLEEGKETYSDLRINGKAMSGQISDYVPQHSVGEFTALLIALFSAEAGAKFNFVKETNLHGTPALLFNFVVRRSSNRALWYLRFDDRVVYPGYHGQVWIDRDHSQLMRIEMHATELDGVPIVSHTVTLDYADVQLGDGSSFVLPVRLSFENCTTPQKCIFNEAVFKGCRKFSSKSRVIPAP
jgi:hypothetical protein